MCHKCSSRRKAFNIFLCSVAAWVGAIIFVAILVEAATYVSDVLVRSIL